MDNNSIGDYRCIRFALQTRRKPVLYRGIIWAMIGAASSTTCSAGMLSGTIDFSSPNDLNHFTQTDSPVQYGPVGAGGSGGVEFANQSTGTTYTQLLFKDRTFNLATPSEALTLSFMFHYKAIVGLPYRFIETDPAEFDLTPQSSVAGNPLLQIQFQIYEQEDGTQQPELVVNSFYNRIGLGMGYSIPQLQDGHWYQLAATISFVSVSGVNHNVFDLSLKDFGASGTSLPGVVYSKHIVALDNMHLFSYPDVQAAFRIEQTSGLGGIALDNFSYLTPEPSSLFLIVLGGLAFVPVARRRSRSACRSRVAGYS